MSRRTKNVRFRFAVVACATAATVAGGVTATPSLAAPSEPQLQPGSYVVVLKDKPSASYTGGDSGLPATQAAPGKSFEHRRAVVERYEAQLEQRQDALLGTVGATAEQRYTTAVNGFSATLTGAQATKLASNKNVLFVQPDEEREVDTVASPEFLGLTSSNGTAGVWKDLGGVANAGKGVVVGIIDTGIWPENPSFAGDKLTTEVNLAVGQPYRAAATKGGNMTVSMKKNDGASFVGACERGAGFAATTCNTKLISARYFPKGFIANVPVSDRSKDEYISPRDGAGHGSHTAGTAVGNADVPVTIDGRAFGRAAGMAPAAKLAVYKVCWEDNAGGGGCYTSDSVAAIDQSVKDGVDVLNYSISGATSTVVDAVEYAFFNAAAAGVFVAASAGNSGPGASTVAHNSPWLTTVAAGTHRALEGTVTLGNGASYKGASLVEAAVTGPVVLSTAAGAAGAVPAQVRLCYPGTLDPAVVTGKIVVCDRGVIARPDKSAAVKTAGGIGMILANTAVSSLDSDLHFVPTVHVDNVAGAAIKAYVALGSPTATLTPGDQTGGAPTPVPQVAGFSSRGPALANASNLLKPDITAPGVSVIAAVAPGPNSGRSWDFYSGTSMSSPHIAGLAALYFGVKPTLSPMGVKSAMMTTAYDTKTVDGSANGDSFAQGAGYVDPKRFFEPGLVVTSGAQEWKAFYAGQGLDLGVPALASATDLNVPSIAVGQLTGSQTVRRTFTAVTAGTYAVAVNVPGFTVNGPTSLAFTAAGDSQSADFTFTRNTAPLLQWAKGSMTLTGPSTVRLPVALRPVAVAAPSEVSGTGVSGSVTVPVTAGFNGSLAVATAGLAAGTVNQGSLPTAGTFERDVIVAAGTQLARFDLDATNNAGDYDLTVYRYNPDGTALAAIAGQSATGSADERVDLFAPKAGKYRVVAENFANAPGETTGGYALTQYLVTDTTKDGALTVTPNPVPVSQGAPTTFAASWSGLTPATPYLGLLSYEGALAPTVLSVR